MSNTTTRPNKGAFSKKENLDRAKEGQVKRAPRGITEGRGIMANISALNLGLLFEKLVHPDRMLTDVDKRMAEVCMDEISGGAKTQNRPDYEHKGEAKPAVKKQHEHSGNRHRDRKQAKKRPSAPGRPSPMIFSGRK